VQLSNSSRLWLTPSSRSAFRSGTREAALEAGERFEKAVAGRHRANSRRCGARVTVAGQQTGRALPREAAQTADRHLASLFEAVRHSRKTTASTRPGLSCDSDQTRRTSVATATKTLKGPICETSRLQLIAEKVGRYEAKIAFISNRARRLKSHCQLTSMRPKGDQ